MVFARVSAVIGLLGAVLVVVGSLGAWATLGDSSVAGVDGGRDGWITLVLAILAAGFLAGIFTPKRVARVLRWFPLPFALLQFDAVRDLYVVTIDKRVLEGGPSWANNAPVFDQAYADRVASYYGSNSEDLVVG